MDELYELRAVSAIVETLKGAPLPVEKAVVADVDRVGGWLQHVDHKIEMSFPFALFNKETGSDSLRLISVALTLFVVGKQVKLKTTLDDYTAVLRMELDQASIKVDSSKSQFSFTTNPTSANNSGIFWFQSFRIFKAGLLKMVISVQRKNNEPCTIAPFSHDCVCIDPTLDALPYKRTRSGYKSNTRDAKIDNADATVQVTKPRQRKEMSDTLVFLNNSAEINRKKKSRECDDSEASLPKKAKVGKAKAKATAYNDDLGGKKSANIDEGLSTSKKKKQESAKTKEGSNKGDCENHESANDSIIKSYEEVVPEITVTKIKKKVIVEVEEHSDEEDPVQVDFVSQQKLPLDMGVVGEEKSLVSIEVVTQEKSLVQESVAVKKPIKVLEEGEIDVDEELVTTSQPQEAVCHTISENTSSNFQRTYSYDNVSTHNTDSMAVKEVKASSNKNKKAAKLYTLPRGNYYRQCKKLLDSTLDNFKLDKIPDQINVQDYKAVAYWLFLHESKLMETEATISNIRVVEEIGDEEAYNPLFHTLACLFLAGKAENVFFKADFLIKAAFGDNKIWKEIFADVPEAANTSPPPITAADIYKYEFLVLCNIKFNFNAISKPIKLVRDWSSSLGGKESVLYIKLMEYFENNKHYLMDKKMLEHGEAEIALARIVIVLFDGAVNNTLVNKHSGSVTPNDISSAGECIAASTPTTESQSSNTPSTEPSVITATSNDPLQLNINPALGLTMTDVVSLFLDIDPQFPGCNKEKLHNLLKIYMNYKSPANMRGICNVGRYFLKNFKKYKDILGVKRPKLDKKLGSRVSAIKPLPSLDDIKDQPFPILKNGIAGENIAPIQVKINQVSSKLLDTDLIKHFAMCGCSVEHAIVDAASHTSTVIFSGNNCIATLTKVVNETHIIRGFILYEALICPDRTNNVELVKSTCHMKIMIKNLPHSCKDDVLFYHFDKLAKVSYIDVQKGSIWFADSIIPSMAKEILYKDQFLSNHAHLKLQVEIDPESSIFVENGDIGPLAIQCRKKRLSDPLKVEDLVAYFRAINDRVILEHASADEYILLFDSNLSPSEVRKVIQNHVILQCEVVVVLCEKSSIFFDNTNNKVLRYGHPSHIPTITVTSPYASGYGNSTVSYPNVSGYGNSTVSHPHVSGYGNSTVNSAIPVYPPNTDIIRVPSLDYSRKADSNNVEDIKQKLRGLHDTISRSGGDNGVFDDRRHVDTSTQSICYDFRRKSCKFGDSCKYIHEGTRDSHRDSFGMSRDSRSGGPMEATEPKEAAIFIGHVPVDDRRHVDTSTQSICYDFRRKSCKFGDSCKYIHEGTRNSHRDSFGMSRDSRSGGPMEATEPKEVAIFIGHVPFDITLEDLNQYFTKYGKVSVSRTFVDKTNFGFVNFQPKSHQTLQELLNEDYHTVRGKLLRNVELAKSRDAYDNRDTYYDLKAHDKGLDDLCHMITRKEITPSSDECHELFVIFVPSHINEDDIKGYFSQYAEVKRVTINLNKRYAFVTFHSMSSEAFNKVMREIDKSSHEIRGYKLTVHRNERRNAGSNKHSRDEGHQYSRHEHQNDGFRHDGHQKQPHIHDNANVSRRSSW